MNDFERIFLAGILAAYFFIAGCLYLANHNKNNRHLQYWSPILALVFGIVVMAGHSYIFESMDVYLANRFPDLRRYLFVFVNLGYLALYAILKAGVIHVSQARLHASGHRKNEASKSLGLFYEDQNGILRVKAEWRFAQQVLRYSSLVCGFLLMLYLICNIGGELRPYTAYLPDYLAFVFLIFAECVWFLSGGSTSVKPSVRHMDTNSQPSVSFEALYNEYMELWPDQILQAGIIHHANEVIGEQTEPSTMLDIVHGLLRGDHLLVRDGMFSSISKVIFPALYRLLLQNKKLILIVETEDELEASLIWFNRGVAKAGGPAFAWRAASLAQALQGNIEANLLVVQTHDLHTDHLMDYIGAEYVQQQSDMVFMVLEGAKLFSKYGSFLKLFALRLSDLAMAESIKLPQYVVFSEWAEDLEDAMQKIFNVAPASITVLQSRTKTFYYAAAAQEKGMLQRRIMPRMVHRVLDPEGVLLIPALKWNMDNVKLVHFDSMPGKDNLNELAENIGQAVAEYSFPTHAIDRLRKDIELHSRAWTVPESDQAVVICRDATRNLIHALGQWLSSGKENALVIVVSPPYLLRDYMAANASFFMQNHRKIASIVPKPALNRKTAFHDMMDQLSRTWLTAVQLQEYLRVAGMENSSIRDGVFRYVEQQGGAGNRHDMLKTRFVKQFVRTETGDTYKEIVLYRLNREQAEKHSQRSSNYFAVQLQSGQTIARILSDHIYQSYLPGQAATFNGSWYRIARIDPKQQRVELAVETLTGQHLYKQSRTYAIRKDSVSQPNGSPIRRMIERFEISLRHEFRSFEVYTNGYFDFENEINLYSDKVIYVPLGEEDQGYCRSYTQGNLLIVTINSLDGEFEHADRLAFTLSYLLNELFVSLYPHNHAHVAVCTAFSESFHNGHDPACDRLCKYVPRMKSHITNKNSSETLQLYVFEDSSLSLGLLESIVQNWDHLLEILDDYLFWVLEENSSAAENNLYIRHGSTLPYQLFSFEELASYIRRWLPEPSLRTLRTQYLKKTLYHGHKEKAAFPSNRPAKSRFTRAEKAQAMTESSAKSYDEVVTTIEDLQEIYREVRAVMSVRLKHTAREGLKLSFVPAQALHSLSGVPVVPATEQPIRMCGQTVRGDQGSMHVYMANATTRVDAIATLAHELTHIWQYDHLQMDVIPSEKLEGHAMWVEISVLESLGYSEEAERIREGLLDRSDIYGKGFRLLVAKLEEDAAFSNPFVFMLSVYGRVAV
ncbi:hypothetical protein [Cohnella sp.]|uniref:hypothetical protein n=1 Tax=Cohnella sp. TaxID=1883426 RepID=UPI0035679A1F